MYALNLRNNYRVIILCSSITTYTHTQREEKVFFAGGGGGGRRCNLKSLLVVVFVEVVLNAILKAWVGGWGGGLNVTDVRREKIPLLWSTVGEVMLAKGFCSNMGIHKVSVHLLEKMRETVAEMWADRRREAWRKAEADAEKGGGIEIRTRAAD